MATIMVGEELLAKRLAFFLSDLGIPATSRGNVVMPGKGTPVIAVNHVEFSQPRPPDWIAHADICFALNPERQETYIDDCATGWAETREQAFEIAAHAWAHVTAPPVFSLLHCRAVHGADWFPRGDPAGLPGWNVFAGPYGFRGDPEEWRRLEAHLREHPLLPALGRPILRSALRPYLNYVKLYRGYSGSEWFCDGFINGVRDQALTDELRELPWPEMRQFTSAALFAVVYPQIESPSGEPSEPSAAPRGSTNWFGWLRRLSRRSK